MTKNLKTVSRRRFLKGTALLGTVGILSGRIPTTQGATSLPTPRYDKLPPWKGFNLLEKFMVHSNQRFREDDFRNMHDLGFNFVRLPMDYRCWIVDKDWRKINNAVLDEIEEAVHLGEKYGVHICMNFHRAPGWTVARPAEEKPVWTDPEALEVCCQHWSTFAKRFSKYGNEQVSFNLFNEPASVEPDNFMRVHRALCDAIRAERSDRLIICDGLGYGREPFLPLAELKVAQATRGYSPFEISHYKASWVNGEGMPEPSWPKMIGNGLLPSPTKNEMPVATKEPLQINGPFEQVATLRIKVATVSSRAKLVVLADGKEIFSKEFIPGPGEGEWEKVVYKEQWKTYQNLYNRDYTVAIPAGTEQVEIRNVSGDWILLNELGLTSPAFDGAIKMGLSSSWTERPATVCFHLEGRKARLEAGKKYDRIALWEETIVPWLDAEKHGIGVIVGEFGAYNKTPHPIVLDWMKDLFINWNQAGWGWALWNFRGSFGILDSQRQDVEYEDWRELKLDRKMLTLLQEAL